MTPIRECSREERLERALLVIEGLTLNQDDENTLATKIYCIAHSANGRCKGGADGKGCGSWLDEVEKLEKTLKEQNIMDVEKILERTNG